MGDCRHFLTVIPRSTTSRNDYNLLAHRRCTVQSNPNTVIIMHVPSVTLCPLVVVSRQLLAQRKREEERSPKGQSHSGGRKRNFTRECNCIFAREARQIDLSNDRRNLSRFPARIPIFERNGHEFAAGASSSATRRLPFDPFCSTRRKLWLGRSDRILRRLLTNFYASRSSFTDERFSSLFKNVSDVTIFYFYLIDRIF